MHEHIRTAEDLEALLVRVLGERDADAGDALVDGLRSAQSFRDAGLLIRNRGLVLRAGSGAEFRVVIIRSERPDAPAYECPDCEAAHEADEAFIAHLVADHGWSMADALGEVGVPITPQGRDR